MRISSPEPDRAPEIATGRGPGSGPAPVPSSTSLVPFATFSVA